MIPLRDNIPSRTTPIVTYIMIAICAFVFVAQVTQKPDEPQLAELYGMIPARITHPGEPIQVRELDQVQTPIGVQVREVAHTAPDPPISPVLTLLTCVFLHGGWFHFLGNMWFLYIFGDNVEDRMGRSGYLMFYLACGVAASASHLLSQPNSMVPTIGASGAIAGVMGAYLYLYPHARVLSLVVLFGALFHVVALPAPLYLGIWFLMQLYSGAASIGAVETTGVAWWAHIGGFAAGFLAAMLLGRSHHLNPPVMERLSSEAYNRLPIRRRPPRWE